MIVVILAFTHLLNGDVTNVILSRFVRFTIRADFARATYKHTSIKDITIEYHGLVKREQTYLDHNSACQITSLKL